MTDIKNAIRQHILANYLPGESPANLPDGMRLQSSGILDSLATLTLISFIEQEFAIELTAYDRNIESLDRIDDIARLVCAKIQESSAATPHTFAAVRPQSGLRPSFASSDHHGAA